MTNETTADKLKEIEQRHRKLRLLAKSYPASVDTLLFTDILWLLDEIKEKDAEIERLREKINKMDQSILDRECLSIQ